MYKDANVQVDTTWLESISNIDNEHKEFVSATIYKKIKSAKGAVHIKDNDDKSDDNMNVFRDTFNEISEDDISNGIVG